MSASFAYMWEYRVSPERLDEFKSVYGPRGDWASLFSRAEGYARTELFQDADDERRFITTDLWSTREARDAFRAKFAEAFDALDARCQALTLSERFVGDFTVIAS